MVHALLAASPQDSEQRQAELLGEAARGLETLVEQARAAEFSPLAVAAKRAEADIAATAEEKAASAKPGKEADAAAPARGSADVSVLPKSLSFRGSLCAMRTLSATGQPRVTLSLR